MNKSENATHGGSVCVNDRKTAAFTGILAVDSFDENRISLVGTLGALIVEGEELHITTLDLSRGVVEASGRIDAVCYVDETEGRRGAKWLSRLIGK